MNRPIIRLRRTPLVLLFVAAALGGCVKEVLYNTPTPDKGSLHVTADWSGIAEDATPPETYVLLVGELQDTVAGAVNTFRHSLTPGLYTLLVHNTPAGITINGSSAEVDLLPDGTLLPLPDYLFTATKEFMIFQDQLLRLNMKMVPCLRSLQLVLKFSAADFERIASSVASLSGIAHSITLPTAQPDVSGVGRMVVPLFRKGNVPSVGSGVGPALVTHLRLAGVVTDAAQRLSLDMTLTDGAVVSLVTDLSEALVDFRSETQPLLLEATIKLPDNPTEVGASATITGWQEVDNGDITIH